VTRKVKHGMARQGCITPSFAVPIPASGAWSGRTRLNAAITLSDHIHDVTAGFRSPLWQRAGSGGRRFREQKVGCHVRWLVQRGESAVANSRSTPNHARPDEGFSAIESIDIAKGRNPASFRRPGPVEENLRA